MERNTAPGDRYRGTDDDKAGGAAAGHAQTGGKRAAQPSPSLRARGSPRARAKGSAHN